jgi:poly(A) polymerase
MEEDKLRLLRAVRFSATLGFELDDATAAAVREMADQLVVVSAERITQELKRMLPHESRRRAVELCAELGLLEVIFPELKSALRLADTSGESGWKRTMATLDGLSGPSFEAVLAGLLDLVAEEGGIAAVRQVCSRLRLSNDETDRVGWLAEHRDALDGMRGATLSRLKRLCAHPAALELVRLVRARKAADGADTGDADFVEEYLRKTPLRIIDPPPLLTGTDLIALGLKPGPEFKRILEAVRDAQLDEEISTKEEAIELARRLHGGGGADTK